MEANSVAILVCKQACCANMANGMINAVGHFAERPIVAVFG